MGLLEDSMAIFSREMLIFKANLRTNVIRSAMFPLIFIIFFGNIGNAVSNVPIAVVNYANNPQSQQFINSLSSQSTVSITALTDQASAMNMLYTSSVDAVVIIEPQFPSSSSAPAVDIYYSSTEQSVVAAVVPFVESAAAPFGAHVTTLSQETNSNFVTSIPTSGAGATYEDFLVAGIIIMSAAFGSVFSGGFSVILDRQLGNLKTFFITPISKNAIILGKLLAGTVQSVLYGFIALGLGLALGASIAMGVAGLVWILLIVVLVSVAFSAIALLIASRLKAVEVYAIIAQIVVMPAWVLSGAFTPISVFPPILQSMSAVDPMTYATNAVRQVMLAGYIIPAQILLDLSVLGVFSLIVVALAFAMFKSTID